MTVSRLVSFSSLAALALGLAAAPVPVFAAAVVGQPAPAFTLTDTKGKQHSLADFAGKTVVLEWLNHDCPFVKKHYESGNMQALQAKETAKGVVWLSVVSSAPGKEGHHPPAKLDEMTSAKNAKPTAVLLDSDGTAGRAYGAKTTPHMFVIDGKGVLAYAGAIDDKPSTDQADVKTARSYVDAALEELRAGKPVSTSSTTAYGCGVKY